MTDSRKTMPALPKLGGATGATGASQCFQQLSWPQLQKTNRGQSVLSVANERKVAPVAPVAKPEPGPANTLILKDGPGGPSGPGEKNNARTKVGMAMRLVRTAAEAKAKTDPDGTDADGVARTPEAIERVWSEATRRAVEYRKTQKPPTCAHCGQSDWTVSVTELTGRKLHVQCWKAE